MKTKKIIAIDIGYGDTKVHSEGECFKFPTAISLQKTQMLNDETESYIFEGKKYNVGEDGLRNALETRDYAFIYKYSPILIAHALKLCGVKYDDDIIVNTGLSLYDLEKSPEFDFSCANRKEEFKKRISKFTINENQYKIEIKLFAQGQGIWNDFCIENGIIEKGYDVVIDIGYRTKDILVIKDGSPSKTDSSADDKGINEIVTELQIILNKKYDISFTEPEVNEILLDKKVTIFGVDKDLSIIINEIIDAYVESLINSLKAKFGNILKIAKRVIISGGGAYIIMDYKSTLPLNIVFKEGEHEFSNVRGYYHA